MKTKNAVVGSIIEVKKTFTNTQGGNEHFKKGLKVLVADNDMSEYHPLKVEHKDIEEGYAWVDAKHFRKVKEVKEVKEVAEVGQGKPVPSDVQEGNKVRITRTHQARHGEQVQAGDICEVLFKYVQRLEYTVKHPNGKLGQVTIHQDDLELVEEVSEAPTERVYKVGDKVLVGAEGAGFCCVDPTLANKVCTISAVGHLNHSPKCVKLVHPVLCPWGYSSLPEYISPYVEAVVEPEPVRPEVGDWVVANAVDPNLVAGIAYKVVGFSPVSDRAGIALHTHCEPAWQKVYYINTEDYSTVLREVKPDADTPTA